ncbi:MULTISPECIES: SMI1/KNR4 family protein [Streptomyces]|uniref:Cell wall assembly protein Knr4 n=1 Tax=Streptomyces tsukubensis (strain DSM 42081 / NBRC 108919 / NRRL 18488 / 9993) TaxID=1114943 RepID=A0A7G3UGC8_STRT9|nr:MULTISPECIES: SMI1/KNR4 family protein [Streptomyces]AZK94475.1 cell wall assembly protein Knr4 [Streptomyces tsukubensis]MYS65154.1 cell wall assembly protein Knr4 [Streptomyces sp. SID5473]QKM69434.1 cell wall assembly protein Knr4 [Streptomyces tsukubensis NRRL18488]TAI42636.1 cell wall assembly protein Knr4 [Streptomyces tsukubensis]
MTTGTTGRQGPGAPSPGPDAQLPAGPPNAAYAGQVVHFPDPVRAARHPRGVRVDADGYPDFSPYARAAAEIAEPPEGFGIDELRLTDYVSANAALHADGHEFWDGLSPVATPHGWTWHHVRGSRRMELIPVEVKALLRHHGGLATAAVDHGKRGTRPLQETRPAHLRLPRRGTAVAEPQLLGVEEDLGYRLPGAYRDFLKAAGGCAPVGPALDPELGLLVDQPFFTIRDAAVGDDLVYVNKCLRDHLTKDYLGIAYVQGGLLALKVRGTATGSVRFCAYDDIRDRDGEPADQRVERLLQPCGDDFDAFLGRLAGSPPELETVAGLMVDGGFARAVPVSATDAPDGE